MRSRVSLRLLGTFFLWAAPLVAAAQDYTYTTWTLPDSISARLSISAILTNVVNYLAASAVFVAAVMFTLGAFYVTFSRGEADTLNRGKGLIIGATVGMAVVLGSYAILRTVFYIIYA